MGIRAIIGSLKRLHRSLNCSMRLHRLSNYQQTYDNIGSSAVYATLFNLKQIFIRSATRFDGHRKSDKCGETEEKIRNL